MSAEHLSFARPGRTSPSPGYRRPSCARPRAPAPPGPIKHRSGEDVIAAVLPPGDDLVSGRAHVVRHRGRNLWGFCGRGRSAYVAAGAGGGRCYRFFDREDARAWRERTPRSAVSPRLQPRAGAGARCPHDLRLSPAADFEDRDTGGPSPGRRCPCCGGRMIIVETFDGARPARSPSPTRIRIDTS